MSVQTGIPSRSRQLLIVLEGDVTTIAWVLVPLGQSKVNHIDYVLLLAKTDQEVVWLDVSMQESTLVDELDALYHLDRQHQDRLVGELSATVLIEIF